jgi:hypothetical protein
MMSGAFGRGNQIEYVADLTQIPDVLDIENRSVQALFNLENDNDEPERINPEGDQRVRGVNIGHRALRVLREHLENGNLVIGHDGGR